MMLDLLLSLNVPRLEDKYRSREIVGGIVRPPLALRMDGVSFGRSLSDMPGPRSEPVHRALVETARLLLRDLGGRAALVVSDEINVLLERHVPYGGRLFKLVSVAASKASAHVSLSLGRPLYFDARVIGLESPCEALEYFLYRSRVGLNNYVTYLAHRRGIIPPEHTPKLRELIGRVEADLALAWGTPLLRDVGAPPRETDVEELRRALCG